ncbi:toxin-antitoxin system HicB family antitoxin [Granulicella cerasi]|uniref:Toxin-antitoxin system HicB family antitoxin n=1 Tax=Granulicella cerasi TaxID=741063 RepID=A0ABW1Z666_9BACT
MEPEFKRHQSFPLRLSPSVREHATSIARSEGISLNHFVSLAIAEKISRMEHDLWMARERSVPSQPPGRPNLTHTN